MFRLFLLVVVLSGCSSAVTGPANSIDPERDFNALVIDSSLDVSVIERVARNGAASERERNRLIAARMAEIDVLYHEYENRVTTDIRRGNFGTAFTQLLLGSAGSLSSGSTSQGLSALSALVSGTKAAYDRDLLLDQSMQAFVSQMRASRANVKARIVNRMEASTSKYTLQTALSDLNDYQQAGTLASALAGITKAAQEDEETASQNLKKTEDKVILFRGAPKASSSSIKVRDWINSGATAEERRLRFNQADTCFKESDGPTIVAKDFDGLDEARLPQFLVSSERYKDLETKVLGCLSEKFQVNF